MASFVSSAVWGLSLGLCSSVLVQCCLGSLAGTKGVDQSVEGHDSVPIDFILNGILPNGEQMGLDFIPGYLVRVLKVASEEFGCAQSRNRIYIVGVKS